MDTHALRTARTVLKARCREDPAAARATLRARGRTVEAFGSEVESGGSRVVAGMRPGIGGSGAVGCPDDLRLESLIRRTDARAGGQQEVRRQVQRESRRHARFLEVGVVRSGARVPEPGRPAHRGADRSASPHAEGRRDEGAGP